MREMLWSNAHRRRGVWGFCRVLAVVMALSLISTTPLVLNALAESRDVRIIRPKREDLVCSPLDIQGKVRRLQPGEELWVLIRDPLGQWWVQRPPVITGRRWLVEDACVGEARDVGLDFIICAVITTTPLECGQRLPAPPSGLSHCIEVTRDDCWIPCPACP